MSGLSNPIMQFVVDAYNRENIKNSQRQWDFNPQISNIAPPAEQDLFPYIIQALQQARASQFSSQLPSYSFGAGRFISPTQGETGPILSGPPLTFTAPTESDTKT